MRGYLLLLPLLFALPACGRVDVTTINLDKKPKVEAKADDKSKADSAPSIKDWSFWRGPEQNGVSRERDLPEKFSLAKKENVVFVTNEGSIGSPVILNNTVYLLGKSGEGITQQERVMAFDADTGKKKWEKKYNVWHTDIVEDRIGFTNIVADPETGNIYAHLTSGLFVCLSGKDGKEIWTRSLGEEFGRVAGYGGRVTSPIVDEDRVIVSMVNASWGEQTIGQTRVVAFDKKKGDIIWWGLGGHRVKDTYSSVPVVAVINGERLLITGGGDGCVHAFQARTGKKVWTKKIEQNGGAINCSPVVKGNKVWIGHGEENVGNTQGRVVCLDAGEVKDGEPKVVWQHDGVKVKFASPVLHEGLLYVCDEAGKLFCFDAEKGGDPLWEYSYGTTTKGSPVWADGKIYISDVDSKFNILKPSKEGCEKLTQFRFRGKGVVPVELHGSPAVYKGRVYFTTTEQLVCIGKPKHDAKADKIPEAVAETGKAGEPAHIQIVPADVTLKPGASADLKAFAYDAKGKLIGEVKAEWSKDGMRPPIFPVGFPAPKPQPGAKGPPPIAGEIAAGPSATAKFTAAKMPNGMFGRVVAKADKLTGEARIRTVPVLPYANDFSKVPEGRTPGGWVNTMGKFSVVKGPDGELVLFKRNDNPAPPVARVNAYIGDPDAKDYTIECDVYSTKVRDKDQGDVGVGAMRYTLLLIGNDQELRLSTWDAQKRIEKKVKYPWKDKTWYRLKLMATVKDGKGIIKGKVWPRGEKEPAAWTVEAEDPIPNTEGAPLVYGFPNGTINASEPGPAIYYANLKITPNGKK